MMIVQGDNHKASLLNIVSFLKKREFLPAFAIFFEAGTSEKMLTNNAKRY
jgi:hypothetical protein